jgi:amidase
VTIHRFVPDHYHRTFGSHAPVLTIADGDTVRTTTVDAAGRDARDIAVTDAGNPLTGPFEVEGAEPGDVLSVRIDAVRPNRTRGFSSATLAPWVVDGDYVPHLGLERGRERLDWTVDTAAGEVRLARPPRGLGSLAVPLAPMLGCLGVAPDRRQAISTATSGAYGGNMDYRVLGAGVTLHFPVFAPGALLFVGDGHAIPGAGELAGTGVEISCDVAFTVRLLKAKAISWPRGETDAAIFTIGNARPLEQAVQHATTEMVRWLREDHGLDAAGAAVLVGQCADYDLGNMFDPAYTMVCRMERRYLEMLTPRV